MNSIYRGDCKYDELVCPFGCPEGVKITPHGTTKTLVGNLVGEDRNHHWTACTCENCSQEFTKEYVPRGKKVWYTAKNDDHVLLGSPGCCIESYLTNCNNCNNGWVKHSRYGVGKGYTSINGYTIPTQPLFNQCLNCTIKTGDQFYDLEFDSEQAIKERIEYYKSLPEKVSQKINFVVKEEIGAAWVNLKGINKLTLKS